MPWSAVMRRRTPSDSQASTSLPRGASRPDIVSAYPSAPRLWPALSTAPAFTISRKGRTPMEVTRSAAASRAHALYPT